MSNERYIEILKAAWKALGRGDWDTLAALYSDSMIFVLPGQNDVLRGKPAFRLALERIGDALPPGFEVVNLSYFSGEKDREVVNIVEWKSTKVPDGTQSAILWKFSGSGEITEERWYIDTVQWKAAF